MPQNTRPVSVAPTGREKRAYERHVLSLPAMIVSGGARRPCEIRDFCPGGMLLALRRGGTGKVRVPAAGEVVRVVATVPPQAGGDQVRLTARIVRAGPDRVGVALVAPDRSTLELLARYAKSMPASLTPVSNGNAGRPPDGAGEILSDCRGRVLRAARVLVDGASTELCAGLTEAGDHLSTPRRTAVWAAEQAFSLARTQFGKAFLAELEERIDKLLQGAQPPPVGAGSTGQPLALVEDDALTRWLSITALADHVETRMQAPLAALERRLGHLLGRPLGRGACPFGPLPFALAFQESLEAIRMPPVAKEISHELFRDILIRHLETLYDELNGYLIARDVLPRMAPAVVSRDEARGRPARGRRPQSDEGAGPPPGRAREKKEGEGPTREAEGLATLLNTLISLQRGAGAPTTAQPRASGGTEKAPPTSSAPPGLAARLLETVREVVSRDTWSQLSRLEAPLHKLAQHDDGLLADRLHAARELINRVAQLDSCSDPSGRGSDAIRREIAKLIDRVANEPDIDPVGLEAVARRAKTLAAIQEQAFAENLQDVILACESEQQALAVDDVAQPRSGDVGVLDPDELLWLRRTARLQPGAWIGVADDSGAQRRLRLAWVSASQERYVFVDGRGLRELDVSLAGLAGRLRTGQASLLDDADEPVLDRAEYRMLQRLHQDLVRESAHDHLTGLFNRREFDRRLALLLRDNGRAAVSTVVYVDIAQVGVVNAACGYEGGDRLLRESAALLAAGLGEGAVLARVGSDEFAALLERPMPATEAIARTQIERFADYRFRWTNDRGEDERLAVSLRIGMVGLDDFDDASAALQAAEASCRAAGVNQMRVYRAGDDRLAGERRARSWLTRIDRALDTDGIDLRYQRIIGVGGAAAGATAHCEVLIALTDESGNPVSPQEFVAAAEHYHRMPAVDRHVIGSMFRFMAAHPEVLPGIGGFAINVSGRSLSDPSFKEFLLREARTTGVPMDRVCFEITETAGIDNLSDASAFIAEMKETGCLFSLDDFGSGLSSYAYLKNLPVDFLKVDGTFVEHMDSSPTDYAVVRSIAEIGHFMGKKIIAERVENEAVLALLRDMGVDYAQGYAIGRPLPLRELLTTGL